MAISRADALLPTGTVTFLFTDIEGSTRLWEREHAAMQRALARHDAIIRAAIDGNAGYLVKTTGDGAYAAFAIAAEAVAACLAAQRALDAYPWGEVPIKSRMALHTGAAEQRDGDYYGPALNRAARLMAAGHGGQILLSLATAELVRDHLPADITLRDMGERRLKDLIRPERVYQVIAPDLPADFPPLRTLDARPNNLPQQLTSFIGREKEIANIEALLASARLLTLTGSGGSGKTRLSLHVAADSLEQFPDGAWFVDLAPLSDPGLLPQVVASVLGLKENPGTPITQTVTEHLKHKRLLLLVDNCEHLLDACAKVADALMRECPGVRILATSRQALGIAGEQTYRVPSLSLPDCKQTHTPNTLSQYESVQLFIDRALLVRPDFQVTNRNAPALASLCHHLDGIPLAIELAAARVRSLSVEEIDGKLDQRFRLLTGGSRTALPRQQTLRSLIDWSYDLLHEPEKSLLQRISVFAGGWALAAAEEVCTGEHVEHGEVLDLLTSLCDKSLVVAEQNDGHSRYRLPETMRQYAAERLVESGRGDAVRERHRDYFLALAQESDPHLMGAGQAQWLRRLEEEHDNLRSALEWSLGKAEPGGSLRLCGALTRFWMVRGHLSEGRAWCLRALGKAGGEDRTQERAKALNAAGVLASYQGDYSDARARHEESLAIRRELADRRGIASSLHNLGNVADAQSDHSTARALFEESLAIKRELGDRSAIAFSLNNLGIVAREQGDLAAARALQEESLAIVRELGDRWGIASALNNLASVTSDQGDLATAQALYEESLAIRRDLGDRVGVGSSLINLGNVAFEKGDFAATGALYKESLTIQREVGERRGIAYSLQGLAAVAAAVGNPLRAAGIWGAGERLRGEVGLPVMPAERPHYDRQVAEARVALGDDAAFDRAWHEGRSLTLEQAIELALE